MSKIWYPYLQHKNMSPPLEVDSAKGVHIKLKNGKSLIGGISSWWSVIHGYSHDTLDNAIKKQLNKMSHMMLCGLTHDPAQKLASKLIEITPDGLEHVFYSDSGSVGCEVALKMALQYWRNKKMSQKNKFIAFKKSYHGDTTGVMSVGDPDDGMHAIFNDLLPKQYFLEAPPDKYCEDEQYQTAIKEMELFFKKHHSTCAAVIIEPLLQAAGGFNMYKPEFLIKLRDFCNQYNVLLIFDEVATGFGRTGSLFACNQVNVTPDILVLGKGLTAGYIGLSATISHSKIFDVFYSNKNEHALMHGPTFMGNPLACSVALESINLFLNEQRLTAIKKIETILKKELLSFIHPCVKSTRVLGATGVIELCHAHDIKNIQKFAQEKGVWLRPFDRFVYTMPAYTMKEKELLKVTSTMKDSVLDINY